MRLSYPQELSELLQECSTTEALISHICHSLMWGNLFCRRPARSDSPSPDEQALLVTNAVLILWRTIWRKLGSSGSGRYRQCVCGTDTCQIAEQDCRFAKRYICEFTVSGCISNLAIDFFSKRTRSTPNDKIVEDGFP